MQLAGKSRLWPVATALATMLAIVVGLHADVTHARDEPKEHRKKAPVRVPAAKAKIVPHGKIATPTLRPKRDGAITPAARALGPTKTKEHDTARRKTAKTDSKVKEPRKTR